MALTALQLAVLRLLAERRKRSGESYVAGGVALNQVLQAPRISRDVDPFHDTDVALAESFREDRSILAANGFSIEVTREARTFVEAAIVAELIQWVRDSAYRFFPLVEDELLGLTLHPLDLATNKLLALVGRLESRDWIGRHGCPRARGGEPCPASRRWYALPPVNAAMAASLWRRGPPYAHASDLTLSNAAGDGPTTTIRSGTAVVGTRHRLAAGAVREALLPRCAPCALYLVAATIVHFATASSFGLAGLGRAGLAHVAAANLAAAALPVVRATGQLATATIGDSAAVGALGCAGSRRARFAHVFDAELPVGAVALVGSASDLISTAIVDRTAVLGPAGLGDAFLTLVVHADFAVNATAVCPSAALVHESRDATVGNLAAFGSNGNTGVRNGIVLASAIQQASTCVG